MTIIEKAVQWAIQTANDNSHGYSQVDRYGPDYDCSSFVISAWEEAGVPVRHAGASYTGNMRGAFIACGFADVTTQVGLSTGYGIQAGDVLLNYSSHTCLAIGNGKVVNCRTDEGNPQSGDQSGNEIRIQNYWNYPWNCVLRFKQNEVVPVPGITDKEDTATATLSVGQAGAKEDHSWRPGTLKRGGRYDKNVVVLQSLLNARGFNCGNADGYFGVLTEAAVNHAKRYYDMERNGECDYALWIKLLLIER